jgi:long-subunit acyl-CoA synthetase (AMP-forming)
MTEANRTRQSLLEDLDHWAAERPAESWLVEHWSTHRTEISWAEGAAQVRATAAWLANTLGQSGARVGLLCPNRAHWMLADIATMASGNVLVPVFTTMKADVVQYIADFVDIDLLFLGGAGNWEQVRHCFKPGIPVVRLPGAPAVEGAVDWEDVVSAGARLPAAARPDDEALATIVFTSGTTGLPKGVMHSMKSLREAGYGVGSATGTQAGWRFLSYLPLAHLGERIVVEMNALPFGGTVYFNESLDSFLDDLRHAKPQWFLGVPRIWEKLQQAVHAQVLSPEALVEARQAGQMETVSRQVQEFLGLEEAEYILTSTAPTPAPLKAWYDELGIELHDGYGQSEILPISANRKGQRKPGSIGQAGHGVEIRIAEDGEIQSRAPGTAMGYYKAPDKTAETFIDDGWVRTGDKGYLDDEGHLFITGRVKEIFKTAKGKYVAPAPIEGRFLDTPLAEQACLTGLGLAQTVMLLVLSEAAAARAEEEVHAALLEHAAAINNSLDKHERIGALIVSTTPWALENDFLTHTLKLKRDRVDEHFAGEIAAAGDSMRDGEALFVLRVR